MGNVLERDAKSCRQGFQVMAQPMCRIKERRIRYQQRPGDIVQQPTRISIAASGEEGTTSVSNTSDSARLRAAAA
jgi:hypothetical protein